VTRRARGCEMAKTGKKEVPVNPESFIHKVEEGVPGSDGVPSKGPVYRSFYAKDKFCDLPEGMYTTWDTFV